MSETKMAQRTRRGDRPRSWSALYYSRIYDDETKFRSRYFRPTEPRWRIYEHFCFFFFGGGCRNNDKILKFRYYRTPVLLEFYK